MLQEKKSVLYRFKSGPWIRYVSHVDFECIGLYIHALFVLKHQFFFIFWEIKSLHHVFSWRKKCTFAINNWTNFVQISQFEANKNEIMKKTWNNFYCSRRSPLNQTSFFLFKKLQMTFKLFRNFLTKLCFFSTCFHN